MRATALRACTRLVCTCTSGSVDPPSCPLFMYSHESALLHLIPPTPVKHQVSPTSEFGMSHELAAWLHFLSLNCATEAS